jgi:hypothetical protein
MFSLCSVLYIGEQGTTALTVQLGECAACGKAMFRDGAYFESIDDINTCVLAHEVKDAPQPLSTSHYSDCMFH